MEDGINEEGRQWLKQQLRTATWTLFVLSVLGLGLCLFVLERTKVEDSAGALAAAVGIGLGTLWGRIQPKNLGPIFGRPFKVPEDKALAYLKSCWKSFHPSYVWVVLIPYLGLLAMRAGMKVSPMTDHSIGYFLLRGYIGLCSSAFLCESMLYAHAYFKMGKEISSSDNPD